MAAKRRANLHALLILVFLTYATDLPVRAQRWSLPARPPANPGSVIGGDEGAASGCAASRAGGGCAGEEVATTPKPPPKVVPPSKLPFRPGPTRVATTGTVASLVALRAAAKQDVRWRPIDEAVSTGRRVCIDSYPWLLDEPIGSIEDASPELLARNRESVERVIEEMARRLAAPPIPPPPTPEPELQVLLYLLGGGSRTQAQLYGDFLCMRALVRDHRDQEAAQFADSIRAARDLKASPVEAEPSDLATYFSEAMLKNAILYYETRARARLVAGSVERAGAFAAWLLACAEAVDSCRPFLGDPAREIVPALQPLAKSWPSGSLSERMSWHARVREIAAVVKGGPGEGTTFFVGDGGDIATLVGAFVVFESGRIFLARRAEAQARYREYCHRTIEGQSTRSMQLFHCARDGDGFLVESAGNRTARLSADDYSAIVDRNGSLPADHPVVRILSAEGTGARVQWTSPLMTRGERALKEGDALAFALQRVAPGRPVYRDPLAPDTAERVERLNAFRADGPNDIAAVVDDGSFQVADYRLIQNIEGELAARGVTVRTFDARTRQPWTGGTDKALIVLSGHTSAELQAFLEALGDVGCFRGNYVLLLTCQYDPSERPDRTRRMIDTINSRHGARGVFGMEGKVSVDDLEPFLLDLLDSFRLPGRTFGERVRDALEAHGLNGVWTICLRGGTLPRWRVFSMNPRNRESQTFLGDH